MQFSTRLVGGIDRERNLVIIVHGTIRPVYVRLMKVFKMIILATLEVALARHASILVDSAHDSSRESEDGLLQD